jgi:hypothetical protein
MTSIGLGARWRMPLALFVAALWAATEPSWADPAAGDSKPDAGWQFAVTPYVWLSGLWGDVGVTQAIPPEHVSLSPWEVLNHLGFGVMGAVEARHGPFVIASDNLYVSEAFSSHIGIRDPDFLHASLKSKVFISTNVVGYRAIDKDGMSLDVLAGARLDNVDTGVQLTGPRRVFAADKSMFWADPILGLELRGPISSRWSYSAYGDVGGFGAASKLTGQILVAAHYSLSRQWSAFAGWRYLYTDYNHNGFVFRTTMTGPELGATYRF